MTAVATPIPEEIDDLTDDGLTEAEHVEMAWHLREMREQIEDMRCRLQMAFPQDDRYERWCNSMLNGVGNIRAALVKDLRLSHRKPTAQAKQLYADPEPQK